MAVAVAVVAGDQEAAPVEVGDQEEADPAAVGDLEEVGLAGEDLVGDLEALGSFQVAVSLDRVASLVVYAMRYLLACHASAVAGCCKIVSVGPAGPMGHLAGRVDPHLSDHLRLNH